MTKSQNRCTLSSESIILGYSNLEKKNVFKTYGDLMLAACLHFTPGAFLLCDGTYNLPFIIKTIFIKGK